MTYSKSNQCDNGFLVAAKSYTERNPVYEKFIDYPVREYPTSYRALYRTLKGRGSAPSQE